jgi:hypothetical protein
LVKNLDQAHRRIAYLEQAFITVKGIKSEFIKLEKQNKKLKQLK